MEKRTPDYSLALVSALVKANKIRITGSAIIGAEILGVDRSGIVKVVSALRPSDFYKSMTTYADHTIWQDVYHPKTPAGDVYLKLTVSNDLIIVSFKEL